MNHISKLTRSRWLLLTLFTLLVGVSPTCAQTTILSEDFESNSLSTNEWTTVNPGTSASAISTDAKRNGTYGYKFCYYSSSKPSNSPRYLISKQLSIPANASNINLSFFYSKYISGSEKFAVGYSTTTNEVGAFTWSGDITNAAYNSWKEYNLELNKDVKYIAIQYKSGDQYYLYIDDITITCDIVSGPGFAVKDGSTKLSSPYAYSFGLTTAGTTKTFKLTNPGNAATPISVDVTGANGFTAAVEDNATSIPAGGEKTLTITMPNATASGSIVVTPTVDGLSAFTFNVSGTVRDPNKVYLDFSDGQMPEGWTSVYTGTGDDYYNWTAQTGYVQFSGGSSYKEAFTSPKLTFAASEEVLFEVARYGGTNYTPGLTVEFSTDGTDWSTYSGVVIDNANIIYGTWTPQSVTIPSADVKYIRFNGYYLYLRNIYGGQLPLNPTPKDLAYSTLTNTSAQLSWTSTASNFNIQYKADGAGDWTTIENVTENPYTLTGLSAVTTYQAKVQADHGVNGLSDYTDPISFTTKPDPISAYPYTENFNSLSSGEIPQYWDNSEGTTTTASYKWVYYATGHEGKCVRFDSYTNNSGKTNFLKTRPFSWESGKTMKLSFWYKNPAGGDFSVYASTDGGLTYPTELATGLTGKSDWTLKEIDIPAAVYGSNVVIVFKGTSNYANGDAYLYLDDMTISEVSDYSLAISGSDVSENTIAFGTVKNTTTTKTFTITNDGGEDLTGISVVSSDATAFTVAGEEIEVANFDLASGATKDITVTYIKGEEKDGGHSATITVSQANIATPLSLTVTGNYVAPTPATIAVKLGGSAVGATVAYGTVGKAKTKTFTVSNTGEATLNITSIESSNTTDFTVSPAGETGEFTVTFVWDGDALNAEKTANITLTASNAGLDPIVFAITGTRDNLWSEDFEGVNPLNGWENSGFTVKNQANLGSTNNGTTLPSKFAVSNYSATASTLITPCLEATAGDKLSFDAYFAWGDETLKVEWSEDKINWHTDAPLYNYDKSSYSNGEYHTIEITAPITGPFYLRFSATFSNAIDNIEGFKLCTDAPAFGYYTNSQCTVAAAATVTRNYGFVTEAPEAVVYYMKNDGTGTLNLTLGDVPTGFTAALGKASLAADESTTLTINMPIATKGYRGGDIVVTGKDSGDNTLGTFTVTASGVVEEDGKMNLNFAADDIPATWTATNWEKNGNVLTTGYSSSATLLTSKLVATAGETIVVVARNTSTDSSYKFGIKYKDADDANAEWADLVSAENIGTDFVMLHGTIANAGNYLFQFNGGYAEIQRIYGLATPLTKNFGMVSDEADAVWTLTVKNEGQAKLEGLAAALSGEQAAHYSAVITGATGAGNDEIEAEAQATVTVKQLKDNLGAHEATLTISATGLDSKVITLSGSTRNHTLLYVDFDGSNDWPAAVASHGANWEVYAGYARQNSATASSLVLAPLTISDVSDALHFKASRVDTNRDLTVRYTTNGGVTWNDYNFGTNETPVTSLKEQIPSSSFSDFEITNIPAGPVAFDFYGQSVKLDNITADYSFATAPLVAFTKVTDNISDANLTADADATYTLANIGNANYVGTVAKSNVNVAISGEGVTYEDNTLTIPAGKTAEITVTMPFAAPYGAKNGSMTITSESWVGDVAVNYTANLIDPDAINIDFASAPAGWYNAGWTVDGSAYIYSGVEKELITEQYAAEAGKNVLSFKAKAQSGNEGTLKVYTSTDRKTWSEPKEFTLSGEYATKSLDALADGNYYVKFVSLNANIDDLTGLKKIATVPEHDLYVSASNIPTATKVPGTEITATATVYSLRAAETGVSAKLFFDETVVATADAQDISLNGSKTFTLTGNVPATEKTYAAKIVVYYGTTSVAFETLTTNVEVQHTRTLAITSFTRDGEGDLSANVDNKITAQFNVTVQNNSTCDLTADEVKVSIVNAAGDVYQMNDADNVTAATAVLAKDASVVIPVTLTISAGEGGDFKFRAKELVSNTTTLEANDITIHVNAQAPQFALNIKGGAALADGDDVAFGLVKEATTKQYTISNTGTKALVLTSIVAPAGYTVTEINNDNKTIAANGTLDIDVTLLAEQGKKAGNLVFTYDVNGTPTTFTLALTGRSEAANVWEEYFTTEIPASWQKTGWAWNADRQTAYSGGVQGEFTLMTPRLSAAAGQVLTYETKWQYDGENMTIQYSTDKTSWTDYETITASTETVEHQFVAPAAGNYYLKFTANRYVNLDNFIGFALNIPEHDMELAASNVPTTGKRLNSYVATVTLKENAGKNEEITAELWVAGAKVNATANVTSVEANSNATVVTLTWEPQTTLDAVNAYVKVTYAGGTLETTPVSLTIAEVYTLSESSSDDVEAVTNETVMLQRTFAAGWNTICLPFAVADNTAIETLFGAGAKVFNFKNFANNMIEFEAVTSMAAATPYLIYVPVAVTEPIRVNNVTITGVNTTAGTVWHNSITFQGSYAPVAAGGLNGKYGVTTANKLAKGNASTTMKGFRAYFEGSLAGARIYTFDDATGISHVYQAAEVFGDDDRVYNMNGQHVENAKKGVYIVNGRKVVIK